VERLWSGVEVSSVKAADILMICWDVVVGASHSEEDRKS